MKTLMISLGSLGLLVAGCAAPATRDTWSGSAFTQLQTDHQSCLVEANHDAIPAIASKARRTLYKDCMEQRGYRRLQSEQVPSTESTFWSRPLLRDSACTRQPNQTCWVETASCPPGENYWVNPFVGPFCRAPMNGESK